MTQALFYSSNAVAMTLTASIGSGDVTCALSATTGLPASFPFKLLLDWGAGTQEVVHCTALSGLTATIVRGQDTTTAQSHSIGAAVVHGVSAREYNDLEAHIAASAAVHGLTGSVVGTTDAQTLSGKTLTSPAINGGVSDATSTIGGVSGTSLAADRTAWGDYSGSVTLPGTGATIGNGALYARYKQVGKTVTVDVRVTGGSTSTWGSSNAQIGGLYPVAPHTSGGNDDSTIGIRFTQATNASAWATAVYNGTIHTVYLNGLGTAETGGFSGLVYRFRFSYEAA